PQREDPANEKAEVRNTQLGILGAAQMIPAACIESGCQDERKGHREGKRPGFECLLHGWHHHRLALGERAALRAGGWPSGRRVPRNATSAVVSGGLKFLA